MPCILKLNSFNITNVRPFWILIERKFGALEYLFKQILGLDPLLEYDAIATIISLFFLIYKEWLLSSLESKTKKC